MVIRKIKMICLSSIILLVVLLSLANAGGRWYTTDKGYKFYDTVTFDQQATWSGSADSAGYVQGEGTMRYYKDGKQYCIFEGTFVSGIIQGNGITEWVNGSYYKGEFRDGEANGKGVLRLVDGSVYEGDFVKSKWTGNGVLHLPSGERYEGEFLNNTPYGYGTIYGADNRIIYQGEISPESNKSATGNTAPPLLKVGDVIKSDEFQSRDGSLLRVEYSNKPTILWFWADFTMEKWFKEVLPVVQEVYDRRGNEINAYTINISGNWERVSEIMERYSCSVPTLKSQSYLRYSQGFPCIVIIDKDGVLRFKAVGQISLVELNAIIDSL